MKRRKPFEVGTALRTAAIIAFFLLLIFVTLWVIFGIDTLNLHNYLFGAIIFCVALVTVSVFQSFRISESAEYIAEGLATEMVNETHDLFVELYRKSPVPYILIDHTGRINSTNSAAIRLFNVGEGQLDGENVFEFVEGDEERHVDFIFEKFTKGLSVKDEEMRIVRTDGSTRWVLLSLFSFPNSRNKEQEGFLTLVDITEQKEIDRAKSEFVSLASHQLRTPLTAMKWSLELLFEKHRSDISEGEMKYLSKVKSNLDRMGALINDFLSVSKFELGTYVVDKTKVDISKLLNELIDENMPRIEQGHVKIEQELEAGANTLNTDEQLMRMIISNLLSNAIKYSREGGAVYIKTKKKTRSMTLTIADSGMGIPLEEQERLFTKMFRAKNARRDVPDGTGLGLYIVDYAVKTLGGTITFDSEENKGTTFTIELPV